MDAHDQDEVWDSNVVDFVCCFDYAHVCFSAGIKIIQRNVRGWCTLRSWPWFRVYSNVKPLIAGSKQVSSGSCACVGAHDALVLVPRVT